MRASRSGMRRGTMAAKGEKDAITGVATTGHEWDGIRELDNPHAALVGLHLLRVDRDGRRHVGAVPVLADRSRLFRRPAALQRAARLRAALRRGQGRPGPMDRPDRGARRRRRSRPTPSWCSSRIAGGETAFKNNCATCHGLGGAGQGFFPSLADDSWIWGGTHRADRVHRPPWHPKRPGSRRARQRDAGLRHRRHA